MPEDLEDEYSPGECLLTVFHVIEALDRWHEWLLDADRQTEAAAALVNACAGSLSEEVLDDSLSMLNSELLVVGYTAAVYFLGRIEPPHLRQACASASFAALASFAREQGNGELALFLASLAGQCRALPMNDRSTTENINEVCLIKGLEIAEFLNEQVQGAGSPLAELQEKALGLTVLLIDSCQRLADCLAEAIEDFVA